MKVKKVVNAECPQTDELLINLELLALTCGYVHALQQVLTTAVITPTQARA